MKVKLFTSMFESTLERKVNAFIPQVEVVEIKFCASFGQAFVLIIYNE